MNLGKTIPVLRIFDEAKAKAFYVDFLGFKIDWAHRFEKDLPLYLQISKNHCVIHLTEHHGDCCPGAALRIETDAVVEFQKQLLAKQYSYARPEVKETPWGSQDMSISDPFGNRLTFTDTMNA